MDQESKNQTLPEFVDTNLQNTRKRFRIPTNPSKEVRNAGRVIIREAYKLLLSKLNGMNFIRNDFLNENVYIIWKEGFQKATNNATRHWQTTYAVLKLPEIIKHSKPFDENYRCVDIKEGSQTKNRYVELIKLRYTFNNNGMHVQYSLEYIKKACS